MKGMPMKLPSAILPLLVGLALTTSFVPATAQTQVDLNEKAAADYRKADSDLNSAYKVAMAQLAPQDRHLLQTAQQAWIKYRDADADARSHLYEGGSIEPMVHFQALTQTTLHRTQELQHYAPEQ
jgi:uncharacterized protein YecT (DUF1311 family)